MSSGMINKAETEDLDGWLAQSDPMLAISAESEGMGSQGIYGHAMPQAGTVAFSNESIGRGAGMLLSTPSNRQRGRRAKATTGKSLLCQKEKLAILGTADSLMATPWEDSEFEIWAVAQCVTFPVFKRADILFEMHTEGYWRDKNVMKRLKQHKQPLYMQDHYPELPQSMAYPKDAILGYRRYHTTSITYMLALAYYSFVTTKLPLHVALFGVHMEAREEYTTQRPCCEYWLGRMEGAGMDIFIAGGAILRSDGLYGYEGYNPLCAKLRMRMEGLANGRNVRAEEMRAAELKMHEQEGAIKENEYWLRLAQTGQLNDNFTTMENKTAPELVPPGET